MKPTNPWKIIIATFLFAMIFVAQASMSFAAVTINGTVEDTNGNPITGVNISIYIDAGLVYQESNLTNASGFYNITFDPIPAANNIYNITFTHVSYISQSLDKLLMNNSNYDNINRNLAQASDDFDGDGVINSHDCLPNDGTKGTINGVYDNTADINCNGIYSGDEYTPPSSSSSSSSDTRRSSGGPTYTLKEKNITTLESFTTELSYTDILRLYYNETKFDFAISKLFNETANFRIGRPLNEYFLISSDEPILNISLLGNETPEITIEYKDIDLVSKTILLKISLFTYKEPVIVPEVPETINVTIPEVEIPVINDSLINESNMTGNVFSRISESLKSIFGSNEENSEETTLFQKPIVIIPILLLIGAGIGVGAIILIKKVTAANTLIKADRSKPKKKVKKSKKDKEYIEKKIDLPKKITQVLETQFEDKKKDKLGVKKLKY